MFFLRKTALFLLLATWLCSSSLNAQSSETQQSEFVSAKTFMAISINMEKVVQSLPEDSTIITKYRQRKSFSKLDFSETNRINVFLTSDTSDQEYATPFLLGLSYNDELDQQATAAYFLSGGMSIAIDGEVQREEEVYETATHNGHAYLRKANGEENYGNPDAIFFSNESTMLMGNQDFLLKALEGESDSSDGKDLVGNIDSDFELHVLIEDGSKILSLPDMEFIGETALPNGSSLVDMLEGLNRAELIVNFEDMTPIQATIEMSSESLAEELESLIQIGIQAAPALIMMGESQLDAEEVPVPEGFEDIAASIKKMLTLVKKGVGEIQVERDGKNLELRVSSVDGLETLPGLLFESALGQQMQVEKIMEEFQDIEGFGFGEAEDGTAVID